MRLFQLSQTWNLSLYQFSFEYLHCQVTSWTDLTIFEWVKTNLSGKHSKTFTLYYFIAVVSKVTMASSEEGKRLCSNEICQKCGCFTQNGFLCTLCESTLILTTENLNTVSLEDRFKKTFWNFMDDSYFIYSGVSITFNIFHLNIFKRYITKILLY